VRFIKHVSTVFCGLMKISYEIYYLHKHSPEII